MMLEWSQALRASGWRVFAYPLLIAFLFVIVSFLVSKKFTASVLVVPQNDSASASILGQVLDAGMLGRSSDGLEPFYSEILESDSFLDEILTNKYSITESGESLRLHEVLRMKGEWQSVEDSLEHSYELKERLRSDVIGFNVDKASGLMQVSCTVPIWPVAAREMANTVVGRLEDYALEYRTASAKKQRQYLETRVGLAENAMNEASSEIAAFVAQNRLYQDSPVLTEKYKELSRRSEAKASLWAELSRQLETARLEEEKTTSPLAILEEAQTPMRKSGPSRSLYLLSGYFLGLMAYLVFLLVKVVRRHSVNGLGSP